MSIFAPEVTSNGPLTKIKFYSVEEFLKLISFYLPEITHAEFPKNNLTSFLTQFT